jgi:hypothetical protein
MKRFLGWLVGFFLPICIALPALAAVTTETGPNRTTVSFVNGDTADSSAFVNACQQWQVSFDLGGGSAAATIYGMANPALATGASGTTVLTNGTLTVASLAAPVTVSTALPYLKIDVVTGPSSGTASVFMYCVRVAGGGSGSPGALGSSTPLIFGATADTADTVIAPSLTNVTGFSQLLAASASYSLDCFFITSATNVANGVVFGFTPDVAVTNFDMTYINIEGPATSVIDTINTTGTTSNTNTAANSAGTGAVVSRVLGRVVTSGAVTLQAVVDAEAITGGGTTVHNGSFCSLRRYA